MRHIHWVTRKRMQRLFEVGLGAECHRRLLRELSGCRACAQEYRRYQRFEALLCGSTGPTPFAIERIEELVLGQAIGERRPGQSGLWAIAAAFATAVSALLLYRLPGRSPEQATLASEPPVDRALLRGGEAKQSDVGIRLFRVTEANRVDETQALRLDDVVTFSYTNVRPEIRHLALIGIQNEPPKREPSVRGTLVEHGNQTAQGQPPSATDVAIRWYYPGGADAASIPIESDKVDEPLGDGFRLGVHHACGWLRVVALFSERPIGAAALQQAARSAGAGAGPEELLSSALRDSDVLEHSLLVHIECTH